MNINERHNIKSHKLLIIGLIVVVVAFAAKVIAQEAPVVLPEELLKTEVKDWKVTGLTIVVGIQLLGRFIAGLRNSGGIAGAVRGIVFGTNTPPPPKP